MTNKFRATLGLDSAGEKVVNVGLADRTVMTDGVNVEYLIQENTLQQYDPTRRYLKDFAVIYDNRIWVSNRDIPKPAGAFSEPYWISVRVDPKWKLHQSGDFSLQQGDYISVDTDFGADMNFILPLNPSDGTTIVLKDIGGRPGYNKFQISSNPAPGSQSLLYDGQRVRSMQITYAYSEVVLVFSNRLWNVYIGQNESVGTFVTPAAKFLAQANDRIVRRYTSPSIIEVGLPRNANHGDIIYFTDLEAKSPQYHLKVTTFDANSSLGSVGTREMEFRTAGDGFLIYDSAESLWRIWEGDLRTRLRIIRDSVNLVANEHVMVFGANNATPKTIDINLPEGPAVGDYITISLNYMRKGQIVNITATGNDTIASSLQLLQFPKRSEYPPETNWIQSKTITFNGTSAYVPVLKLSYIEDGGLEYWVVAENNPTVERVDSLNDETRKRLGVIALASQAQANANHEQNPEKELAITPETLANRTATETRRGIARLATTAEVVQDSTFAFLDDVILTPKKLNQRVATETSRGLAEIATQSETNAGTDDSTIITPKKLEARRATETMAGIAALVVSGGTPGATRDVIGTGIYQRNEHTRQVTPKTLFENKATQTAQGGVWLATSAEVIAAPADDPAMPLAVTPQQLHTKTATETRIGFSEIATQAETNAGADDFRFVTPKKLHERKSSETLEGIARIATQSEFDAGIADNLISTPLKIKTLFNSTARTTVDSASGLRESGTLWSTYSLNIVAPTETLRGTARLATQPETDLGTDDTIVITPRKLHNKKATETAEGIVQIATQAEVVAGVVGNKAVPPKHLKYLVQTEPTWQSTPTLRGFVKMTEGALTWVGNNVDGSTKALDLYEKNGYAISPYELNKTLANYLPLMATAENSRNLGGQGPDKYIRRDIDQTVLGSLTLNSQTNTSAPIVSTNTIESKQGIVKDWLRIDGNGTTGQINFNTGTNTWSIESKNAENHIKFKYGSTGVEALRIDNTGNMALAQTFTSGNRVEANKGFSVEGGTIVINPTVSAIVLGTQSKAMALYTPDANTYNVIDPSGTYQLISTKNLVNVGSNNFVNRAGSIMSGSLGINNTLSVVLSESIAYPSLTSLPSTSNQSAWTAEITTPAKYNTLPGYAVPIMGQSTNEQGETIETGIVVDYEYFPGPGTLTQHGNGITGVYQIWAPRPAANQANHNAQTFWIRNFNKVLNKWDGFARMFTSDLPPTASELGAVSQTGGRLNNLTIRDWFQIGNVRMRPNPDTRTLEFDWIN